MQDYEEFIKNKTKIIIDSGFDIELDKLNENLFDYQKLIVRWALRKGRCALFEDTGLGKTIQQLEWANQVHKYTNKPVLILSPLAVASQTELEAEKFGIVAKKIENNEQVINGINIINYEKLHKIDTEQFIGVVLDESSILKSFTGKESMLLIKTFNKTPYKLSCSATPSPNDYTEIGTQAEFLNVCEKREMLSLFFINDASSGIGWRLKGHSEEEFYKWISNWAILLKNPSNLGFDDSKFILPELNMHNVILKSESDKGFLFGVTTAKTLSERRNARKQALPDKIEKIREIIEQNSNEKFLVWCNYNDESEMLKKAIPTAYEIKGSDKDKHKEYGMIEFAKGNIDCLISKPSICGFGMNWQVCHNIIFCGLSDSFEQFYQAIRRCYRFGQTNPVNVYIVISEKELSILDNVKEKENKHKKMSINMINIVSEKLKEDLQIEKHINKQNLYTQIIILPKFLV